MKTKKDYIMTNPDLSRLTDACTSNEDDLTWLAENVEDWADDMTYIARFGDGWRFRYTLRYGSGGLNYYKKDQWLQRRKELGLEVNQPENPGSSEQPVSTEWINGFPPVGVECKYRLVNHTADGKIKITAWTKCLFLAHIEDSVYLKEGCTLYEFDPTRVEFRPIQTEEQKAEKSREEFESSLREVWRNRTRDTDEPITRHQLARWVYDWLTSDDSPCRLERKE